MSKKIIKLGFMLILCILVVAGAILLVSVIKSYKNTEQTDLDNASTIVDNNVEGDTNIPIPSDMVIPTPEPSSELGDDGEMEEIGTPPDKVVIMSGTSDESDEQEDASNGERYVAVKKDVSWEQAKEQAEEMGGHLVTISSKDELTTVIQYCTSNDIDICWIGCHRENGNYVWENNEDINIDDLGYWGTNEPSYTDQGVAEDYIMLWWMNGKWSLNDSESDPMSRFPRDYEGKLGYIVEFER